MWCNSVISDKKNNNKWTFYWNYKHQLVLVTCMEKVSHESLPTLSLNKSAHWTLIWFASLQCVLQLEWQWVLHALVGIWKKISRIARLNSGLVQLDVLLGAEGDPEDYMCLPDTNVNDCSWGQGVPQWDLHYKSPALLGFSSCYAVGFSSPVLLMMMDCVPFDQWIIYSVKPLKEQISIQ